MPDAELGMGLAEMQITLPCFGKIVWKPPSSALRLGCVNSVLRTPQPESAQTVSCKLRANELTTSFANDGQMKERAKYLSKREE